jgi:cell division protein FtsW (lipid II flippase)
VFLAGLSWRILFGLIGLALMLIPTVIWPRLHGFQRDRVLTFLDPNRDPLGNGFHILQSQIAIGSGGVVFGLMVARLRVREQYVQMVVLVQQEVVLVEEDVFLLE